jgi:group I intron endonuclease
MNTVVYQWLREDGTPYYIGIGNPRRPYKGRRRCGHPPSRDRIIILHENLEWEEACRIEKELIAFYGRKDLGTGILRNLTDGGEGAVNPSKETREKISKSTSGENNPNFGKSPSKETREKLSKSLSGRNNPMFGKSHSEKTRKKMFKPKNWYHPDHGKVLQKSSTEMVELFPEQNLCRTTLSRVARGEQACHKGWIALKA